MYLMFASRQFHPSRFWCTSPGNMRHLFIIISQLKAGDRSWCSVSVSPLSHTVMQMFAKLGRR
jgi:hypothetical protein